MTDFSMVESMPFYNFTTGVLELPELLKIESAEPVSPYAAQLKNIYADSVRTSFELLYAKKLQ